MKIIPAIDLMNGKVVRLKKGDPYSSVSYNHFGSPIDAAKKWIQEGATILHIIDLDAAIGRGDNQNVITSMVHKITVPLQVGGGIRSKEKAESLLRLGVKRVIIATLAFQQMETIKALLKKYGNDRIMIALDYLEGNVMIKGWTSTTGIPLRDAIQKFHKIGVKLFLLTSISKDGLLTGPDYITLQKEVRNIRADVFAAGGIRNIRDLLTLKQIGLKGAIIGKALYEERFNLKDAIKVVEDYSAKRC